MASIKGRHDKLTGFPSTINEEDDDEDGKAIKSARQLQAVNGSAVSSGPENGPGPPNVWKTAINPEEGCGEVEKKSMNFVRHRGKRKQSFSGSVGGPTSLGEEVIEDFNDEDQDGTSAASVYRDPKHKPQALLEQVDYR